MINYFVVVAAVAAVVAAVAAVVAVVISVISVICFSDINIYVAITVVFVTSAALC